MFAKGSDLITTKLYIKDIYFNNLLSYNKEYSEDQKKLIEKYYPEFIRNLIYNEYSFPTKKDVGGAGMCMYYSIAYHLCPTPNDTDSVQKLGHEIKKNIIAWAKLNRFFKIASGDTIEDSYELEVFTPNNTPPNNKASDWGKLVDHYSKDDTWGDNFITVVAAQYLNLVINIYEYEKGNSIRSGYYKVVSQIPNKQPESAKKVYLWFIREFHYQALIVDNITKPSIYSMPKVESNISNQDYERGKIYDELVTKIAIFLYDNDWALLKKTIRKLFLSREFINLLIFGDNSQKVNYWYFYGYMLGLIPFNDEMGDKIINRVIFYLKNKNVVEDPEDKLFKSIDGQIRNILTYHKQYPDGWNKIIQNVINTVYTHMVQHQDRFIRLVDEADNLYNENTMMKIIAANYENIDVKKKFVMLVPYNDPTSLEEYISIIAEAFKKIFYDKKITTDSKYDFKGVIKEVLDYWRNQQK